MDRRHVCASSHIHDPWAAQQQLTIQTRDASARARAGTASNVYTGNSAAGARGASYNPNTGVISGGAVGGVKNGSTGQVTAGGWGGAYNTRTDTGVAVGNNNVYASKDGTVQRSADRSWVRNQQQARGIGEMRTRDFRNGGGLRRR